MTQKRKPSTTQNVEEPKKTRKEIICEIVKKKSKEKFLSDNQKIYYDLLKKNQITICSGPAGTGKSYISLKAAVDLISDPNAPYEKIIILRPAVESSDSTIGLLPGDVIGSGTVGTGCYLELNGTWAIEAKEMGKDFTPIWLNEDSNSLGSSALGAIKTRGLYPM
jgi:hypothetical protein